MEIVVDSLLTRYQSVGKGKTVLLLHGWGDSLSSFYDLSAKLSRNYQVVSLDLPGFGQTQAPPATWGLDDYAKFVANFAKKAGLTKIFAVVGHSNGGAIAIRGLANNTLKTEKLVLLDSAGVRSEYKGRKYALRVMAKAGKVLVSPLPKAPRENLRRKAYKLIGSDMFVAEHLQETFKKVVTDDVQADAAKIKVPTLLIYGQDDKATPPEFGEKLASKIAKSKLEIIEHAGHFAHHDQPEQVGQSVEEFLA